MKIKDQIRSMRDRRNMTVTALADAVGVSDQAVRYWEAGRSYPSKKLASRVEAALDFRLDWSEGEQHSGDRTTANALIDQQDIDLLLLICRLPYGFKGALGNLVRAALDEAPAVRDTQDREEAKPAKPFNERTQDRSNATTAKRAAGGRKAPAK